MKIILLGLLAFLVLVSGCIQAPGECQQIGEECCTEDFCVNTSVFMCGTGTFKKVTGCNLTNCVPIISCESESKPIQNQTLPESNETNASQEEQLPEPVEYVPAGPDPEFENFTWTLPTGASTLRLSLPADIDDFLFDDHGGIGGYGLHSGGHIEGLDHTWIELKSGIPVRSWADGYVEDIQSSGDVEGEEYHIRISYGQNLVGNHMEIKTPYVEKYQNVTRGQEIGMGMSFNPLQSSAEMSLVDKGRTDGIVAWGGGVSVSPFDYLMDSDKRKLVDAYKKNVIEPWLKEGKKTWGFEPSEPYLTNKLLIHDDHPGELAGAWYLTSADWEPEYPNDMLTFIEADNPYYKGNVVRGMDDRDSSNGDWHIKGTFEVDYERGRVKITNYYSSSYYGIFEIDESNERAVLKIEYREGSYPSSFSSAALTYIQRSNLSRREDAAKLGVLK